MSARVRPRLGLITDLGVASETRTLAVLDAILATLPGPALVVGLRDHSAPLHRRWALGRALVEQVRPRGGLVLVHDRCDLAAAIGADGVQLGARSVSAAQARALLGDTVVIARSAHDEAELRLARDERCDWVTLGPPFASPSKGTPLGEAAFATLRARFPTLHVLALGGVAPNNVAQLRAAGADGVVVIRALLAADDPATIARTLLAPFAGR